MEIPKPDYSELRKSIPTHENTLDPRLRRILRIKDDHPSELESNFALSTKASPFSPPHEPESTINMVSDPRRQRIDPRRPNAHLTNSGSAQSNSSATSAASTTSAPAPSVLNKAPRSVHLDIQNILQKSNWYKDLSSKQKIVVNQQMAIVSTELKKFHADPSENKIFDLNFINQNTLLQEVLTNLGIFISDDGEFVQLDQQSMIGGGKDSMQARTAAAVAALSAAGAPSLADLMSLNVPIDIDYLRNQQQQQQEVQHHQQQQAAVLQAQLNAMGGPRFLGAAAASAQQMLGFGSIPTDVIRPGILGIPPNIQLNDAYNLIQNANQNAAFFNQRAGGTGNNSNNNGGGGGNNNRRTGGGGGGIRRNQFDRNNLRRK